MSEFKSNIQINIEDITPSKAQELLQKNHNNRKLSSETVRYYADMMERGQWKLSPEGISFDRHGFVLDGQHRLEAIILSNTTQKFVVARGFDRDDVFTVINTGKARSAFDVFNMQEVKNSLHISTGIRRYMLFKKGLNTKDSSKRARLSNYDLLQKYQEKEEYFQALGTVTNKFYQRIKLLSRAEMFAFISMLVLENENDYEVAISFFDQLTGDSDIKVIIDLRRRLVKSILEKAHRLTELQRHVLMIKAWNSFKTNIPVKTLSVSDKEAIPEIL